MRVLGRRFFRVSFFLQSQSLILVYSIYGFFSSISFERYYSWSNVICPLSMLVEGKKGGKKWKQNEQGLSHKHMIKIAFSDRNRESVEDNKGIWVRARGVILDNARLPVHAESPKCVRRTRTARWRPYAKTEVNSKSLLDSCDKAINVD